MPLGITLLVRRPFRLLARALNTQNIGYHQPNTGHLSASARKSEQEVALGAIVIPRAWASEAQLPSQQRGRERRKQLVMLLTAWAERFLR